MAANEILVVDDEVGIRELLSEILHDEGYIVALAENAGAARAYRSQKRPDLVLLDIWMPDTDGITLLKEWESAGLLTMPVVMMSGHGTIDTAVEATRIGAADFLEKPIALQKLLGTVERALKKGEPLPRNGRRWRAWVRGRAVGELKKAAGAGGQSASSAAADRRSGRRHGVVRALPAPSRHSLGCAGEFGCPGGQPDESAGAGARRFALPGRDRESGQAGTEGAGADFEQAGKIRGAPGVRRVDARLPQLVEEGVFDARLFQAINGLTLAVPSLREHARIFPILPGKCWRNWSKPGNRLRAVSALLR